MTEADGPTVTLRTAVVDDTPLVLRLIKKLAEFDSVPEAVEATEERLAKTLFGDRPLAHIVLAELDGRAVGFASYFFTYSTWLARPGIWLDDLYVDAEMRSGGVGRAILEFLAKLANEKGCGRLEWIAAVDNERGLAFYRRHGASIQDRVRVWRLDGDALANLGAGPGRAR